MKDSIKRQGTSRGYLADNISRLSAYITLLVEYPGGVISLIGNAGPPTAKDLYMCPSVRRGSIRKMGVKANKPAKDADTINKIAAFEYEINRTIKTAGGWERITEEVQRYAREHEEKWQELVRKIAFCKWYRWYRSSMGIGIEAQKAQNVFIAEFSRHIATKSHSEKQIYPTSGS
jgi:hypothetical protein